jgi:hypothetical protein
MTMMQRPIGTVPTEGNAAGAVPPAAPEQQIEGLERIQPLIARWNGGMASLWTYSISHGKLIIRLNRPTIRGNLHLSCYDCRRISAPTVWGGINMQISAEDTPEGRRYVIRDDANKVEIRCGFLTAQENVEPIY